MNNSRELRAKRHSIELFKYFVQFLEIFGQENYGGAAEINWPAVYSFCDQYGLFDFNDDLEEIVYSESEEEFRDKAFAYVEKQILDGYPVWRLFNMSEWLYNQLEKELMDAEYKKDIDYFNKVKCYRCKHYNERMEYYTSSGLPKKIEPGNPPEGLDIRTITIQHWRNCDVRSKEYDEMSKDRRPWERNFKFKYAKFNADRNDYQNRWVLNPWDLKRCPYFEDSGRTPEEFIKLYFEICRIYKDKESE